MARAPGNDDYICRREGDYWTFAFAGAVVRVRDSRGIRYLAALLRQPGAAVHVTSLTKAAHVAAANKNHSARDADAATERARISVTKGLGVAIARMDAIHPPLGAHLRATIRRGYYCSYRPDPRHPLTWRVE